MEQQELLHFETFGRFTYICWKCRHRKSLIGLHDAQNMTCEKCHGLGLGVYVYQQPWAKKRKMLIRGGWDPVSLLHAEILAGWDRE